MDNHEIPDFDRMQDLAEEDDGIGYSLRPKTLNEFIGQEKAKEQLRIHIEAAKKRGDALEHVLLVGPPGLGKTTLARIISNEIQTNYKQAIGPVMEKLDLASTLMNLDQGDILFIDEIHRMKGYVQELLYPAMEDYQLDLAIGQGPASDVVQMPLKQFTLIGATTREGLLTGPFRDRFGIRIHLDYYEAKDIQQAIRINSAKLNINIDEDAEYTLACRSRGTMRIANKLLANVRDYAQVEADGSLSLEVVKDALKFFDIDERGLNKQDYAYFQTLIEKFNGRAGLKALAVALSEDERTIAEVYEPYYIKEGFLMLTPGGRIATDAAHEYFNYPVASQTSLFHYGKTEK